MPWQNTVLMTTEKDSITTNSHSMHYVKLTRMPAGAFILNLGENAKQFLLRFSNTATNIASIFTNLLSIGIYSKVCRLVIKIWSCALIKGTANSN